MKCRTAAAQYSADRSHPVRGAWIEIFKVGKGTHFGIVAPREGCVD